MFLCHRRWSWNVVGIVLYLGLANCSRAPTNAIRQVNNATKSLRVLGSVPPFVLTDQDGKAFELNDMRGDVCVLTFIFTRCASTCPKQTAAFTRLQTEFAQQQERPQLISLTVDPGYDTPKVLREYAEKAGAETASWTFLTGDREAIWLMCKEGFRLPVSVAPDDSSELIVHSQRFILLDKRARIRGYYNGLETKDVALLNTHIRLLLHESE